MNKKPLDYSKTIIYKIICKDSEVNDCYVGRTTNFNNRKGAHKDSCNKKTNIKLYNFINNNGGWTNWEMVEIEKCGCKNKEEAHEKEYEWYNKINATLNNNIPTRTKAIWQKDNKEKMAEYARNYYHGRSKKDPEYKKRLCEKEKENKAKRNNINERNPVGRPLKYKLVN